MSLSNLYGRRHGEGLRCDAGLWISCCFFLNAQLGLAVTQLDDDANPGLHALRFKKAQATWTGIKAVAYDGSIVDHQAESKTYDRRVAAGGAFGFEQPMSPNLSVRLDLRAENISRRVRAAVFPETYIEDQYLLARPSADLTYLTPQSLEIFAGATYAYTPAHTQKIESSSLNAEQQYGTTAMMVPHFGLTRRMAAATGGVYYVSGREGSRDVTKVVGDGQVLSFSEPVNEPSTVGLFGEFPAYGFLLNFDAAAISASEGGLQTASGSTMSDDYMRLKLGLVWNGFLKAEIAHKTAAYSKSAYMGLDTIPLSSMKLVLGDAASGFWTGVNYVFGRDKQSIPEMNAEYKVDSFVVLLGVNRAI
jgi:hypothetical protein